MTAPRSKSHEQTTNAQRAEMERAELASLSELEPDAQEARLLALTASSSFDARRLVEALPTYPLPAFAVALHARVTHPDFTSQLPDAARTKKELLTALSAVAKQHKAVGSALRAAKKREREGAQAIKSAKDEGAMARIEALHASAAEREPLVRGARHGKFRARWSNVFRALKTEVFGKWNHYPMLAWADMNAEQRALTELELDAAYEDWGATEAQRAEEARRIGRTAAGPADTVLSLDRPRPLYCAVHDVAAGLRDPEAVLAEFEKLDEETRLSAWNEIARGIYGIDIDRSKLWKDSSRTRTPFRLAFRDRFCGLIAEFSLRAGPAAEPAGEQLARESLAQSPTLRWAAPAASTLLRHSEERGKTLDERWDPLVRSVLAAPTTWVNPALQARLLEHLPSDRADALRKHLVVYS